MEAGRSYNFKVLRKTNIGYMLVLNNEEFFLHNNEATRELFPDEEIEAFLYYDSAKRIAATMQKALITVDEPGWVVARSKIKDLGVFINIGINKDALISKDYLPYDESLWPIENDQLYCILKNRGNRLNAKVLSHNEIKEAITEEIKVDDEVIAYVARINNEGLLLYTKGLNCIMVHKTQMRQNYRLGEEVKVLIKTIDGRGIHGSLIENKEKMIDSDSKIIFTFLLENNMRMPYTNSTDSQTILEVFNMSKKAFKRAIGHLYKERIIDIKEDEIILLRDCIIE